MSRKSKPTSFKKGQSGNPKGRPPGRGYVKWRKEFFDSLLESTQHKWNEIIDKQIDEALTGNNHAAKLLFENVLPKFSPLVDEDDDDLLDNLTDEETSKMYDFLLTIVTKENVAKFIENSKKVTAFVKEMKARRIISI